MSTTAAKPATTPIPVQLSETEFSAFILPHLLVALAQAAEPWVLMSAITRMQCQGAPCGPMRGQPAPQRHRVQSFRTAEACLKVREQLMQRVDEATTPVNALVEARTPAWYIQTWTMFVCEPDTETTEEQRR